MSRLQRSPLAAAAAIAFLLSLSATRGAQRPAKRLAPPAADAQDKSLALIRSVFRGDYDKARSDVAARRALAGTLLKQGGETKEDDALRFVALRQAYELARQGGDFATALRAAAELARAYAVDGLQMKTAVLIQAAAAGDRSLAHTALQTAAEAEAVDDYDTARRLAVLAGDLAGRGGSRALRARAQAELQRLDELAKEFVRVKPALEALRRNPRDPAANLAVGKFRCLAQGRWREGLPLLARGGDPAWRALAKRELANPDTAAGQAALGDAWWERAVAEKGETRAPRLRRAYHWYRQALPALTGEARTRVLERSAQILDEVPHLFVGEIRRLHGPAAPAAAVAFSPDGRFVYSVGGDAFVHKADVKTGKEVARFEGHTEEVWAVAVSRDGRQVLTGGKDATVRLWDAASGKALRRLAGHADAVRAVALAPDGRHAVSGGEDRTVRLWDLTTGREVRRYPGHARSVEGVAFSPDGKQVVSASWDRTLRLWEVAGDKEVRRFVGHTTGVYRVAFAPDGKQIVSGSGDGTVRLWDVASGKEVRALEGHTGHAIAVAFAPDGGRVLSGGGDADGTVRLWDAETGQELHRFAGHKGGVWGVAFSPDGRRAVSCGEDGTVRLWGLPR